MGSGLSVLTSLSVENTPPIDPASCTHNFCEKWGPHNFHCCDCHATISNVELISEEDRILEGIVDNSVPEDAVNRGVTIQFLIDFANACNCWDMTTRDVRRRFVMPATRATRCRFVELPEMSGVVGKATTFVSHTWGAKFGALVAALADGGADRNRVVWVDIFAVRQWPSHKPDLDFSAVVRQCKSLLIVCSSLDEVGNVNFFDSKKISDIPPHVRTQIAFLRVWCLVEIHAAILCGAAIVMKGGRFIRDADGNIEFQANFRMLMVLSRMIDIEQAEATVAADKERILNEINSGVGVAALNSAVRGVLKAAFEVDPVVLCAACFDSNALQTLTKDPSLYIISVAECGFSELLKHLIDSGAKIPVFYGHKALAAAVQGGHSGCVDVLLSSGCNTAAVLSGSGDTALMIAAECGHTECLGLLLMKEADVKTQNSSGETALMKAARGGHTDCVEKLIRGGSDVGAVKKNGETAVMIATRFGHAGCVELLLACSGCNPTAKNDQGETALFMAATCGRVQCFELLLKCDSSDLNLQNLLCQTSLFVCALRGRSPLVDLLIKNGCDVAARYKSEKTALMAAAMKGEAACVKLLVDAGSDVNAVEMVEGATALILATGHKINFECVELLIKGGSSVSATNKLGETALMLAASKGATDCVALLISSGADVNVKNNSGWTALMYAAKAGEKECLELLLKSQCDVALTSSAGKTAYDIAKEFLKGECVELLQSH